MSQLLQNLGKLHFTSLYNTIKTLNLLGSKELKAYITNSNDRVGVIYKFEDFLMKNLTSSKLTQVLIYTRVC